MINQNNSTHYIILPFNFLRHNKNHILLVNLVGEYLSLSESDFEKLITYSIGETSALYPYLKGKHIIAETISDPAIELLSVKYRTKKEFLSFFTSLHMIELTIRCNQKCIYCHASSKDLDKTKYDMSIDTSEKVVEVIFMSPSNSIKIEFQGGEPLLNYETIKYIIEYANKLALLKKKEIEFVVCTNLTLVTNEMLEYFADKNICISTSLDGPEHVHNFNRRYRNGAATYEDVIRNLEKAKKFIDPSRISALMTPTEYSLNYVEEIVDEYIRNGFNSIFIRPLNPFGYALQKISAIGYDPNKFVTFYKRILEYIIKINLEGYFLEESFTSLLLTRILTHFPPVLSISNFLPEQVFLV
ncbi:MAG: His-Xaa-Ser system radical SAM maturase HxsB [Thermodesulfobacteriota bacterium]